jgi:quercetin dioxygenase-like cupin family protein
MKRHPVYFVLVLAGLIFAGTMEAFAEQKMKNEPVLWAAEDINWAPLAGGPPGVMSAMLWSDKTTGAYSGLTKFPAGLKAPLHSHTYETKIVVIKGGYTYNGKKYGPGSYLSIPGGDKHVSGGVPDSETIFLIQQPGKFDLVPVESPKEKK